MLVVAFPPNASAAKRGGAALLLLTLLGVGVALCALSSQLPCSPLAMGLASAASVASSCVVVVAFAPQLVETWRTRGRGSLSYTYYFIQSAGCLLVVGYQLFGAHDPVVVWAPPLVGAIMQGLVLGVGCVFVCRRGGGSGTSGAQDGLLDRECPPGGSESDATPLGRTTATRVHQAPELFLGAGLTPARPARADGPSDGGRA